MENIWSLTVKPMLFISIEAREKEQQNNESGNEDYGRHKMESPHVDTYIKRRKGL